MGILVDRLTAYLEDPERHLPMEVLTAATQQAGESIFRQLSSEQRKPSLSGSNIGQCSRKVWLQVHGAEREPLPARAILNFLVGDFAETALVALVRAATYNDPAVTIHESLIQKDITWKGLKGHADLPITVDGVDYVGEVKSTNGWGFKRFTKEGPDETWGYISQNVMYGLALQQETGQPWTKGLFLYFNKETGHFGEYVVEHDREHYVPIFNQTIADVGAESVPERPEWATLEKERIKDIRCQYCDVKRPCWGELEVSYDSKSKPIYTVRRPS